MRAKKYSTLALLLLVFITPGFMAYLFYKNPQWVSNTTNKGDFLIPPLLLEQLGASKKWRMVLWSPERCGNTCQQAVDKLARIRLAMGRRLYQIDVVLLQNGQSTYVDADYAKILDEQGVLHQTLPATSRQLIALYPESRIFIVNPDNYLILAFTPSSKPGDIFHDMKQLLTTSET